MLDSTRMLLVTFAVALGSAVFASAVIADDGKAKSDEKHISGMSILGNDESPKSLVIVPWKWRQRCALHLWIGFLPLLFHWPGRVILLQRFWALPIQSVNLAWC